MPSEESSRPTSEPGQWQERLRCPTESRAPREVNSQPRSCHSSWSADQARQSSRAVTSADQSAKSMQSGGFCRRRKRSARTDCTQPCPSRCTVSECGLASGRWLKSTQAYRKMRRQSPLDHRQDARLVRGASKQQLMASCLGIPGDQRSPAPPAVSSLPAPLPEVSGTRQDPSPLIFR